RAVKRRQRPTLFDLIKTGNRGPRFPASILGRQDIIDAEHDGRDEEEQQDRPLQAGSRPMGARELKHCPGLVDEQRNPCGCSRFQGCWASSGQYNGDVATWPFSAILPEGCNVRSWHLAATAAKVIGLTGGNYLRRGCRRRRRCRARGCPASPRRYR